MAGTAEADIAGLELAHQPELARLGEMTAPLRQPLTDAEPVRGQRRPETLATLGTRDLLIVGAVAIYFPGLSMNEAARRLHDAIARYEAGAWRRECSERSMPARRAGRVEGICWRILQLDCQVPCARTIRFILSEATRCQRQQFECNDQNHP